MKCLITRLQINKTNSLKGANITVMSAPEKLRPFVPTWDMVRSHQEVRKNPTSTQDELKMADIKYTLQYMKILSKLTAEDFIALGEYVDEDTNTLILECYCRNEWFCHTKLLGIFIASLWPEHFECNPRTMEVSTATMMEAFANFLKNGYTVEDYYAAFAKLVA